MKFFRFFLVILVVAMHLPLASAEEILNGAGATFPAPIYATWSFKYSKGKKVKINYQSIGSGGGIRQLANRSVDFGASDDALTPEEVEKNGFLQWPQVIGGVVLVVNIPEIQSDLVLDSHTVSKIFLGEINKWNDKNIKALNKSLNLPDKPITVVYRSDGSGTTAVFTHYLSEVSESWKNKVGEGKSVSFPVGIGAKGNEGVSNYVKKTPYSIGYVEFAYAKQNKLTYTSLINPSGKVVKPNIQSFSEAAKYGDFKAEKHFYTWLTNVKSDKAWPITAATNILVAKEKLDTNKKVVHFFDWAFSKEGDQLAINLDYVPLPASLKNKIRDYWKKYGLK